MVLIIHGFPSDVAALRFEWAWQHPHASRRLTHVTRRTSKERQFDFHLRVLAHMLRTAPWCRLPLTIRWLKQEYHRDFPPGLEPPLHMPVAFGQVRAVRGTQGARPESSSEELPATPKRCSICLNKFQDGEEDDTPLRCFHAGCSMAAHIICLAQSFLQKEPDQFLPIEGQCPGCKNLVLWGDLIRHHKGCYGDLEADFTSSQKNKNACTGKKVTCSCFVNSISCPHPHRCRFDVFIASHVNCLPFPSWLQEHWADELNCEGVSRNMAEGDSSSSVEDDLGSLAVGTALP